MNNNQSKTFTVTIPSRRTDTEEHHEQRPELPKNELTSASVKQEHEQEPKPQLQNETLTMAIDLSDASIEMLLVSRDSEHCWYGRKVLASGCIEQGTIVNRELLDTQLRSMLHEVLPEKINSRAVMSIPEDQVYSFHMQIPDTAKEGDIRGLVRDRLAGELPFAPEEVYVDYHVRAHGTSQQVFCVASPKKVLDAYIEVLEAVNIHPVLIDLEAAAIGRAVLPGDGVGNIHMLLDLGSTKTEISIFENHILQMTVIVPTGGVDITQALAQAAQTSESEAEHIKCTQGLQVGQEPITQSIQEALKPVLAEIPKTCEHYQKFSEERITTLYLAGGGALLPGLAPYLEAQTGLQVLIADALTNVSPGSCTPDNPMLYATVIGLALRSQRDTDDGINLAKEYLRSHPDAESETYTTTVLRFLKKPLW